MDKRYGIQTADFQVQYPITRSRTLSSCTVFIPALESRQDTVARELIFAYKRQESFDKIKGFYLYRTTLQAQTKLYLQRPRLQSHHPSEHNPVTPPEHEPTCQRQKAPTCLRSGLSVSWMTSHGRATESRRINGSWTQLSTQSGNPEDGFAVRSIRVIFNWDPYGSSGGCHSKSNSCFQRLIMLCGTYKVSKTLWTS